MTLCPWSFPWPWKPSFLLSLEYLGVFCYCLAAQSCLTLCNPMDCSLPGISQAKNAGVGCHFLLQGTFPSQGSNLHLFHCRQILYHWATWEVHLVVYVIQFNDWLYSSLYCSLVILILVLSLYIYYSSINQNCDGWAELCSPKRMLESNPPLSVNGTLFGDNFFLSLQTIQLWWCH